MTQSRKYGVFNKFEKLCAFSTVFKLLRVVSGFFHTVEVYNCLGQPLNIPKPLNIPIILLIKIFESLSVRAKAFTAT